MKQKKALIVFAKAPIPGLSKTRLIPALGEEGAAKLQAELIHRQLQRCISVSEWDTQLWCKPDSSHDVFQQCLSDWPISLHEQPVGDLGEKMYLAFKQVLAEYPSAVIVGTDCPAMKAAIIRQAFAALANGNDAVFAPAEDGGYVLLGLKRAERGVFQEITWGSAQVFRQSMRAAKEKGLSVSLLETMWDLDEVEDLHRYTQLKRVESGLGDGMTETTT